MEALIFAAIAAVLVAINQRSKVTPGGIPPGTQPPPGGIPDPTPPAPDLPPGSPWPPPAPGPGPGVYPAGTPGTFPVQLVVQNPGGAEYICAEPGLCTNPPWSSSTVLWFGPGTRVSFRAGVQSWAFFRRFDHFEGPNGAFTRSNPFEQVIGGPGFVRAVFSGPSLS